ncbi:hypothetical protein ACP70R_024397 [Stipagrostis hirtigluma subsp. patula]
MVDQAAAPAPAASADPPETGAAGEEEEEGASPAGAGMAPGERCRAMMEVVAKDGAGGKWKVSKLVVEHNHELRVAPGEVAATVPALGMEFDSVDDAKGFYYGYGERVGFKARTGSNRRSVGGGEKIMQRFLCWRGNYANRSKGKDSGEAEEVVEGAAAAGKRKREPYKTRSRKPGADNADVIVLEKGVGMAGAEDGTDVRNGRGSRRGRSKKGVVENDGESVVGLEEQKEVEQDAANDDDEDEEDEGIEEEVQVQVKEKRGRGRPRKAITEDDALQAHVLRELGVRASQYTNEERKKILDKYLSKRQSRPASGRPTKIASRQALAERRKRGDGGRFLAGEGQLPSQQPSERRSKRLEKQNLKKEEEKAESKEDEVIEAEPDPETEVVAGPGGEPKVQGLPEPEDIEMPLRVEPPTVPNDIPSHLRTPANQFLAPSHIMQAPYVAQQFGLGSLQGFPGMSAFGQIQDPTPAPLQQSPHLQQTPFHSGPQIPQAPPADIQALQFLSSNPQLGHQTTDQGQYTIPVWDFL